MKLTKLIVPALSALMLTMTAAVPVYAADKEEEPTVPPIHVMPYCAILVDSQPDKLYYEIGEELDLSGLMVSVEYNPGGYLDPTNMPSPIVVLKNVDPCKDKENFLVYSDFDPLKAGKYTVTVELTEEARSKGWHADSLLIDVSVQGTDNAPEWAPHSFDETLDFVNKYGCTHVEGNTVCIVRKINPSASNSALFYHEIEHIEPTNLTRRQYQYKLPQSDGDGPQIGIGFGERIPDDTYEVITFDMTANEQINVTLTTSASGNPMNLSFIADEKGKVKETDEYAYLPDCITEYNDFLTKYGNYAVVNNRIFYLGHISGSTGASVSYGQHGKGRFNEYKQNCAARNVELYPVAGGSTPIVVMYKPTCKGTAAASCSFGRMWAMDDPDFVTYKGWYSIGEDMTLTELTEEEFMKLNRGDINGDGKFGVADVVTLTQWLVGNEDTAVPNLMAADLCPDGKIDSFDLCIMRKEAISHIPRYITEKELYDLAAKEKFTTDDMEDFIYRDEPYSDSDEWYYKIDTEEDDGYTYYLLMVNNVHPIMIRHVNDDPAAMEFATVNDVKTDLTDFRSLEYVRYAT